MPDTTNRPTPEQVLDDLFPIASGDDIARTVIGALEEHSYVIAHPDDVGEADDPAGDEVHDAWYQAGWNACRAQIFGDDQ